MNIKYSTSEMGFEGYFPVNYPNLRVLETQLLYLEAYHLPIHKILTEGKTYKGSLLYNIGKGGFEKPYISHLYHNHHNVVSLLQEKFEEVYIYQDGEIGWWNQVDVKLQVWWYNQLQSADGILVPNSTDVPFYKGLFPDKKIKVIRSVMTDEGLDKTKFKPKEDRTIVTGPLTREYNGFSQLILAHNLDMPIDIPPMGESRMPKDSWDMADNLGVNYLEYMSWTEWMYNLNRYKIGYMLSAATASGSFALNCAYLGIPCIGDKRADTQRILFPDLAIDVFDNQKALELTLKLKNDLIFYNEVSKKAKEIYNQEFTKDNFLKTLDL
jgi:hypothetical protein